MCGEINWKKNDGANGGSNNELNDGSNDNAAGKTADGQEQRLEASIALQVLPWVAMDDVYGIVDLVIDYIKSTGVRYVVGPFETTMEGDLDQLLDIVKKAQHIAVEAGAPEVISMVKIAYRPDEKGTASIQSKVQKYR